MFSVGAVVESMRRHALAIVLIFALALGAGVASSYVKTDKEAQAISDNAYTAEAVVYFTVKDMDASAISTESNFLIADARRAVVNDSVAGEIRRMYGDVVSVSSPYWADEEKNERFLTHYVFVDVSAPTQEIALEAANKAAELAVERMESTMPITSATITDSAYIRSGDNTKAADRGTDDLEHIESAVETSQSISVKRLVIFGFVGLFGAIFVFACVDILSRRIRSERDIERMLDISTLAYVRTPDDYAQAGSALAVLLEHNNVSSVCVAGISEKDGAARVTQEIAGTISQEITCVESLCESGAVSRIAKCDSVVLVFTQAAATGAQIDQALKMVRIAQVPVAGAILVSKKLK